MLLLPHAQQRELRACRRCPRVRATAILEGHVSASSRRASRAKLRAQLFGSGPILQRGAQGAGDPAKTNYGVARRCLERHELQRAPPRRPSRASAGTAASDRRAARAVRHAGRRRRAGAFVSRVGLHEGAAGPDRSRGCRAGSRRSAPTASAAATRAQALRRFFEVDARNIVAGDALRADAGEAGRTRGWSQRRSRISASIVRNSNPGDQLMSEFILPNLGDGVAQGDVLKVLVKAGDAIRSISRCSSSRPTRRRSRCLGRRGQGHRDQRQGRRQGQTGASAC